MAKHRTKYLPPFKAEVIQFLLQAGRSVTQIAKELDTDNDNGSIWVNTWKLDLPERLEAPTPTECAAVSEMETEIQRVRMVNEFLTKASAINSLQVA
jgi:transposase-like protein